MNARRKLRTDNSVLSSNAKRPRARLAWLAPAVPAVVAEIGARDRGGNPQNIG